MGKMMNNDVGGKWLLINGTRFSIFKASTAYNSNLECFTSRHVTPSFV